MAYGVHNLINEECMNIANTSHHLCEDLRPAPDGQQLLQHIRNVSFIGKYLLPLWSSLKSLINSIFTINYDCVSLNLKSI